MKAKQVLSLSGQALTQVLVFGAIAIMLIAGFAQWSSLQLRASRLLVNREQALAVAEAGAEYYRWHLAHAPQDYQDGTGGPGPYVHEYYDKDGNNVGRFTLAITPPPVGSTLVKVLSEGEVYVDSAVRRKIEVQFGIASWAKYSYASNSFVWFGPSEETFGLVHSNDGVRLDSVAHNLVSSAQESFNDPDHSGGNEFGVHTHKPPLDPPPPNPVPDRPDVFLAGRQFPVPALDFAGLSGDLSQLKSKAQTEGLYLANSGAQGYRIILKPDDTLDLYRVTSLVPTPGGCAYNQSGWGMWSVQNQNLLGNFAFPANGVIFVEDHVWVEGQIETARLTIASGRFPEAAATNTNIIVNANLTYTNYDGRDVIGLIAQRHFLVGLKSADNLRVDAAVIAKNGSTQRYYYRSACGPEYLRNSLTLNGMSAPYERGNAFAWVACGTCTTVISGYNTVTTIYDANLLYTPPPNFPLTSDQYSVLSWEEIE